MEIDTDKPVSIATEEIAEDLITYSRSEELEDLIEQNGEDEKADEKAEL